MFGEVSIVNQVTAGIQAFTADDLSTPEGTFTPELASLLFTVFTSIFGRRLGTVDDGTTLRATPQLASDTILSDAEQQKAGIEAQVLQLEAEKARFGGGDSLLDKMRNMAMTKIQEARSVYG